MNPLRTSARVLAATTLATGLAVSALAVAPAHAAGPSHSVESLDITFAEHGPTSEACGFPVAIHIWGTWNVVAFTDAEGNLTKEIRNFRFRSESTANGVTVPGITIGPEIMTVKPDGTYTLAEHGIALRRVKGHGTVTIFSGLSVRFVDGEAEVELHKSGPDDEGLSEVCSAFMA